MICREKEKKTLLENEIDFLVEVCSRPTPMKYAEILETGQAKGFFQDKNVVCLYP